MSSMSVSLSNIHGFYSDYTAGKFQSTGMVGGKITLSTKMFNSIASLCSKESSVKQRIIKKLDPSQVKYLEEMERAKVASTIDFKSLNTTWMLIRSLFRSEEEFNKIAVINVTESSPSFEWGNYTLSASDHTAPVVRGVVKGIPFISLYKGGNSHLSIFPENVNLSVSSGSKNEKKNYEWIVPELHVFGEAEISREPILSKDKKNYKWSCHNSGDFFGEGVQPLRTKPKEQVLTLIDDHGRLLEGQLFSMIADWVNLNYLTPKNKYNEVHQELLKLTNPELPSVICDIVMSYYFKKI